MPPKIFPRNDLNSISKKILLPSARHLKEGRGTTIFELPRLENCISGLCPGPLGSPPHPPPNTQMPVSWGYMPALYPLLMANTQIG